MARTYFRKPTALLQCKSTTPQKIYSENGIDVLKSYIDYLVYEKTDCNTGYMQFNCNTGYMQFNRKLDGRLYPSYVKQLSIWESFYDKIIKNNQ
jgi:hypothetical protein